MIAEVVSLPAYDSQVSMLLNEEERMSMEFFIACGPESHPIIPGTGGFRKARWARPGKGKSGGLRAIYFFVSKPGRIYMAAIYAKGRKDNLRRRIRRRLVGSRHRSRKQQEGNDNDGRT